MIPLVAPAGISAHIIGATGGSGLPPDTCGLLKSRVGFTLLLAESSAVSVFGYSIHAVPLKLLLIWL